MKNKNIPLTVKILTTLYEMGEKVGDILYYSRPRTLKEVLYSDYSDLFYNLEKQRGRRNFQKLVDSLIRRGYLRRVGGNRKAVVLTPKGTERVLKFQTRPDYPRRRDKKWQMISFDIPENWRKSRDRFRLVLKALGFKQFQKSMWISPYDTYHEVQKLVKLYKIEDCVRYFLIEEKDLQ